MLQAAVNPQSLVNIGTINISSNDDVKTLFDTEQVISVDTDTGISERPKTDEEKQELLEVSNDLIEPTGNCDEIITFILFFNLIKVFFPDLDILSKVSFWMPLASMKNSLYLDSPDGLSE